MKRSEVKSYEVMTGIVERDDPKELDSVGFEDRICYELEESVFYCRKFEKSHLSGDVNRLYRT